MTCSCLYPVIVTITDSDGDETKYWSMPDDELDSGISLEKIESLILSKLQKVRYTETTEKELKLITSEIISITKGGKFTIPEISEIIQDGIEYIAVMWADPKGADLKSYEVNEHLVYAGCSFGDKLKKGGKMVCKDKSLYIVLHPKLEWENYHIRELKA